MIEIKNNHLKVSVDIINIFLLGVCSILIAIQLLVAFSFISNLYPPVSPLAKIVLPEIAKHIHMERELFLYRIFVITLLVVQGSALLLFRRRLNDEGFRQKCTHFLLTELVFVAILLALLFKIVMEALSIYKVSHMLSSFFLWSLVFFGSRYIRSLVEASIGFLKLMLCVY